MPAGSPGVLVLGGLRIYDREIRRRAPGGPRCCRADGEWAHRALLWLAASALSVVGAGAAEAGDQEPVFFGGEAGLSAGAISAITQQADALWYNPAGLGLIQRNRISLSGSNLMARVRTRPAVLQAHTPSGVEEAEDRHISFGFIPIGMGYVHSVNDRLALGGLFYLRDRDLFETRAALTIDGDGPLPELPVGRLNLEHQRWKMDFGFVVGWQISSRLRMGVGFYGNIAIRTTDATLLHEPLSTEDTGPVAPLGGLHIDVHHKSYAVQGFAHIGLQWDITPSWHLAVVYRTSEAALWQHDDLSSRAAFDALQPLFGQTTIQRVAAGSDASLLQTTAPPILRLALAYTSRRGWVGIEGDISPPYRDELRGHDQQTLWNVRLGGRFAVNERFSAAGGFFTANSSLAAPDGVVNPEIDYYGITMGMQFRAAHRVNGSDNPEGLVFVTTMAARYALGVGRTAGVLYDPYGGDWEYERGRAEDVFFYDLSWYFGTAILF